MEVERSIKVLHVVGAMNRAGTESMIMNIYRRINRNKYQFDFVSYEEGGADFDREILELGGRVITLSKTNSTKQLYDVMKKHGPYDVVHAHTLFHCGITCFAAFLARVKVRIAHAHTTADDNDRLLRKFYIFIMRFLIFIFATRKLACSGEAGNYLFGKKILLKEKYSHFPNVIDYGTYTNVSKKDIEKFKSSNGINNDHFLIGHIGTFKKSKNHHFLLRVMESLVKLEPNAMLLLVGDGELRQRAENLARQMKLIENVKFLGKREDIPTILHSLDVFVFPSLYEGLGMVLLEAQASGVSCIVSEAVQPEADVGIGLVEMVQLNDGPIVWADKIIQTVFKKENNEINIKDAFNRSNYSLKNSMERLQQIYRLA